MLRRTNPAATFRVLLALCLAQPATVPVGPAGPGGGALAAARRPGAPAQAVAYRLLVTARVGHDGPAMVAAPGPEDRDVEDSDGAASPRRPVAALLAPPATPWPAVVAIGIAPIRPSAGRPHPSPRLIAIRC